MTTHRPRTLAALAALLLSGAGFAAPLPAFTARYQLLQGDSPVGEATLTLRTDGDGDWTFTTASKGTAGLAAMLGASVEETSRFRWRGDLPEGLSYDYSMDAAFKHKERHVRFDWAAQTVTVDDKGEHRFAVQPGAIERHTVTLALAAGLAAGKRAFTLPVAVRNRIEMQQFAAKDGGELRVPAGAFHTVEVRRTDGGDAFEVWYAPAQLPVPLQLVQSGNGNLTLRLESYSAH